MVAKVFRVVCVLVILSSVFAQEDSVEDQNEYTNINGTRDKRTIGTVLRNVADLFGYDVQKRPTVIPPSMAPAAAPAAAPAPMPAAAPAPAGMGMRPMGRQASPLAPLPPPKLPVLPPPVTFPPILQEQVRKTFNINFNWNKSVGPQPPPPAPPAPRPPAPPPAPAPAPKPAPAPPRPAPAPAARPPQGPVSSGPKRPVTKAQLYTEYEYLYPPLGTAPPSSKQVNRGYEYSYGPVQKLTNYNDEPEPSHHTHEHQHKGETEDVEYDDYGEGVSVSHSNDPEAKEQYKQNAENFWQRNPWALHDSGFKYIAPQAEEDEGNFQKDYPQEIMNVKESNYYAPLKPVKKVNFQDYYVRPGIVTTKQVDPLPTQDISQFKKYYVKNTAPQRLELPPIQIITQPPEAPIPVEGTTVPPHVLQNIVKQLIKLTEAARRPESTTARQDVPSRYEEYNLPPQNKPENHVSYPSSTEVVIPSSTEVIYVNPSKPRNKKLEREKTLVNKKESNNAYHTENNNPNLIEHDYEIFNALGPVTHDIKDTDVIRNAYNIVDKQQPVADKPNNAENSVDYRDEVKKDYDYKEDVKKDYDYKEVPVKKDYDYKDDVKEDYDYREAIKKDYDDIRQKERKQEPARNRNSEDDDNEKKEPIDYDYVASVKNKPQDVNDDDDIEVTEKRRPANIKAPIYDDYNEEQADAPAREDDDDSGEAREEQEDESEEENEERAPKNVYRFEIPYKDYDYDVKRSDHSEKEEAEDDDDEESSAEESKVVETRIKVAEAKTLEKFIVPTPTYQYFTFTPRSSSDAGAKSGNLHTSESKRDTVKQKKEKTATIADLYAAAPRTPFVFDKKEKEVKKDQNIKKTDIVDVTEKPYKFSYSSPFEKELKEYESNSKSGIQQIKESRKEPVKVKKDEHVSVEDLYALVPENPFKAESKSKNSSKTVTTEEPDHFAYESPIEKEYKEQVSKASGSVSSKSTKSNNNKQQATESKKETVKLKKDDDTSIEDLYKAVPSNPSKSETKDSGKENSKETSVKTEPPTEEPDHFAYESPLQKELEKEFEEEERKREQAKHEAKESKKKGVKTKADEDETTADKLYALVPKNPFKEEKQGSKEDKTAEASNATEEPDHYAFENPVEREFKEASAQEESQSEDTPDVEPQNKYFSYRPRKKFTIINDQHEDEDEESEEKETEETRKEVKDADEGKGKTSKKKKKGEKSQYVELSDFLKNYDNFDYLRDVHGEDKQAESRKKEVKQDKKKQKKREINLFDDPMPAESRVDQRFVFAPYPFTFFSDAVSAASDTNNQTEAAKEEEEDDDEDEHEKENTKYFDNYQIFRDFFKKKTKNDDSEDKEEKEDRHHEETEYPSFLPKLAETYENFDPEKRPDLDNLGKPKKEAENDEEKTGQNSNRKEASKKAPKQSYDKATKFDITYYENPAIPEIPEFILQEEKEQERLAKEQAEQERVAQEQAERQRIAQERAARNRQLHNRQRLERQRQQGLVPVEGNAEGNQYTEEQRPRRVRVRRPRIRQEENRNVPVREPSGQAQASAVVESLYSGVVPNQLHELSKTDKSLPVPIPFDYDYSSSENVKTVVPKPKSRLTRKAEYVPDKYIPDRYTTDFTYTIPEYSGPTVDVKKIEEKDHPDDGPLSENARVYTTELGKLRGHLRASEDSRNF